MHFRYAYALLLLAGFVLVPAFASAQYEWEGWNGDWEDWRDSSYSDKVEDLGDDIVDDMPIPVLLGVELKNLTQNYGDPRGGGTRKHEGLDIVAPDGTPIASPTDAVIIRTGDGADSGLYVRTANPGGEAFVYMHLSKIADNLEEGDEVKRGDIIGFVGNTGNASGGGAHLHFEIREDGESKDPYPRLTEVFSVEERKEGVVQALARGGDEDILDVLTNAKSTPSKPDTESDSTATPAKSTIVYGANTSDIVALQKFLIAAEAGDSSTRLKNTGATGFFGPLTQAALREYQRKAKLEVTGVVDKDTYAVVFAQSNDDTVAEVPEEEEPDEEVAGTSTTFVFTRNLDVGMEGEDVKALQVFLNTHGYKLTNDGPGSPGNETTMFGGLTRAALARYQAAQSISPAVGYLGPITRAHLANLSLN